MKFVLFEKLAKLEGKDLTMLLVALAVVALLVVLFFVMRASKQHAKNSADSTRAMVYGALCIALSFILSYIKLFSMPLGGSITLCSMLPICLYAYWYGPARGFTAAFAYGILQVIQDAYIVHWAQFILDYFIAFSCFGLASLFKKSLPLGIAVAGLARMIISMISGIVFFSEYAAEAGYASVFLYSLIYNASTIGVDTLICVIVALLPPVAKLVERLRPRQVLHPQADGGQNAA